MLAHKIYIVTSISDSDCCHDIIKGVFSSYEKARAWRNLSFRRNGYDIGEYELNEEVDDSYTHRVNPDK